VISRARINSTSASACGRVSGGRAQAVLTLLATRGIPIAGDVRDRILACRDIPMLDRWIARAASAASAADVLEDD